MPLLKSAKTPETPAAVSTSTPTAETVQQGSTSVSSGQTVESRLKRMDKVDAQIMVNGANTAAAGSVGAVQHGGKTPQDYYNRVEEMTRALVDQRLRLLGL